MFSPLLVGLGCAEPRHRAAVPYESFLSLTLLVLRVLADDADHALTANDLALGADLLD
jgi:hypothetical protein